MQLFVYGSLKRGYSNHHWMDGASYVGGAETESAFRLYDYGGFPALVRCEGGVAVKGELYEAGEEVMERLDVLEGVKEELYERKEIALAQPKLNQRVITYVYLRSVEGLPDCGSEWVEGKSYWD